MAARFPVRNLDGTFTVAARFHAATDYPRARVAEILAGVIASREADGAPAFTGEFQRPPVVEWQDEEVFDVVFYGRAESRWWKDWVVILTRALEAPAYRLRFEGFIDRVSGHHHL